MLNTFSCIFFSICISSLVECLFMSFSYVLIGGFAPFTVEFWAFIRYSTYHSRSGICFMFSPSSGSFFIFSRASFPEKSCSFWLCQACIFFFFCGFWAFGVKSKNICLTLDPEAFLQYFPPNFYNSMFAFESMIYFELRCEIHMVVHLFLWISNCSHTVCYTGYPSSIELLSHPVKQWLHTLGGSLSGDVSVPPQCHHCGFRSCLLLL